MKRLALTLIVGFSVLLLLWLAGCEGLSGPRGSNGPPGPAGEPYEAPVPENRYFALAISNNSYSNHNGAPKLYLAFDSFHTAAGDTVVCQYLGDNLSPQIDGIDGGTEEWGELSTTVQLEKVAGSDNFIETTLMRAVWNADYVYFQVQWTEVDNVEYGVETGISNSPACWMLTDSDWEIAEDAEDRLMLMFEATDVSWFDHDGCYITCHAGIDETNHHKTRMQRERMDMWVWAAATSDYTGYISDRYIDNIPRPEPLWDQGTPNFRYNQNYELQGIDVIVTPRYQHINDPEYNAPYPFWDWQLSVFDPDLDWSVGSTIPGYVSSIPSGSAADIVGKGVYNEGTWTVEIMRARITGNGDDTQF